MLAPGESTSDDYWHFLSWAHKARRLRSLASLRGSYHENDARVKSRLRFDFAKQKANAVRFKLFPMGSTAGAVKSSSAAKEEPLDETFQGQNGALSTDLGFSNLMPGSANRLTLSKHQRRWGNTPAEDPQTTMSSESFQSRFQLFDCESKRGREAIEGFFAESTSFRRDFRFLSCVISLRVGRGCNSLICPLLPMDISRSLLRRLRRDFKSLWRKRLRAH